MTAPASTSSEVDSSYSSLEDISKCQELVGSLLFLETHTRPDIALAVNLLFRQYASPTTKDMIAAKRVLRYLKGTEGFAYDWKIHLWKSSGLLQMLTGLGIELMASQPPEYPFRSVKLASCGNQASNPALRSHLQKRTILLEVNLVRKSSGCAPCWENLRKMPHISNNLRRNCTKTIRPQLMENEWRPKLQARLHVAQFRKGTSR